MDTDECQEVEFDDCEEVEELVGEQLDDQECDQVGGDVGDESFQKSWNRCVFGGFISVAAGMLLGTVGTVVLASEMPVVVGTGVGMSMAATYCSGSLLTRSFKKGSKKDEVSGEEGEAEECEEEEECEEDELAEDKDDYLDDPIASNIKRDACTFEKFVNGYKCTCHCVPDADE